MISLFLNTSSNFLNIAILKDNKVIDSFYKQYDKDLSKEALYEVSKLIEKNNLTVDMIDEIVCVRGPGSFTGLRVAATICKTMSYFLNKPLYSVSSLDVMASSAQGELIVPIIDARRGYVYGAIYNRDYKVILEEQYIKLDRLKEIVNEFKKDAVYVSLDKFDFDVEGYTPNIERLFQKNFKVKEDSMTFIPTYLKKTEAEENLNDNRD